MGAGGVERRAGRRERKKVIETHESLSCFALAGSGRQGNNGS